jgi:sugar-specific transcriptional regulator TrmB
MQKTIIEYLEHMDIAKSEAELYLTLLQIGQPVSVRELARTAGINRLTAYHYLNQLTEKGLVQQNF